jgi:hypothetical protein
MTPADGHEIFGDMHPLGRIGTIADMVLGSALPGNRHICHRCAGQ